MIEFTTADQLSDKLGLKMMIYGPAGIGKTMLMATLPSPLIVTAENRVLSLTVRALEELWGKGRADIAYQPPIVRINNTDDLTSLYNWLVRDPSAAQFQSLVIDSLTEVCEVVLENAKVGVKDNRQAYFKIQDDVMNMLKLFRDLPKHFVCTCHADFDKDEITSISRWHPSLPGKRLGRRVPHLFDIVAFYTKIKDASGAEQRVLKLDSELQHEGKVAAGIKLPPVEYPHLGNIINKVYQQGA